MQEKVTDYAPGQRLILPVYNRFDHTILNEIKAYSTYKGVRNEINLPAVEPHQKGMLELNGERWEEGEKLIIEFVDKYNRLIDKYYVMFGQEKIYLPIPTYQGALIIEESDDKLTVRGNGFEIPFCKESGLISNATAGGQVLIEKGPFLNMDVNLNRIAGTESRNIARKYIASDTEWQKTGFSYLQKDGRVWVSITGVYGVIRLNMQVIITPEGTITFDYYTVDEPAGVLCETGLRFYLNDAIEHLQWKRNGYWGYYPEDEFAGNEGQAPFYSNRQAPYGKTPVQTWHLDTHNYFYWGDAGARSSRPLTQAAKGMKENIYTYALTTNDKRGFTVVSADASVACRTDRLADERLALYVNNRWDYPDIAWGNYCKNIDNNPCFGRITLYFLR
jgi:hypothetical protein